MIRKNATSTALQFSSLSREIGAGAVQPSSSRCYSVEMRDPSRRRVEMAEKTVISDMALVKVSELDSLATALKELAREVRTLRELVKPYKILNNKEVKELLGIQDKLLKKYRDDGLLGYSQIGDKYWYQQDDIDKLLLLCKVEPIISAA